MIYELIFLMTAIRKVCLQYAYYQWFASETTEIEYSNDRFGMKDNRKKKNTDKIKGWRVGKEGCNKGREHIILQDDA